MDERNEIYLAALWARLDEIMQVICYLRVRGLPEPRLDQIEAQIIKQRTGR
jgi:hypothetical protein